MKQVKSKYKDFAVYGFDTETPNYKIRLLPISDGTSTKLYDVTAENILPTFLNHFAKVREQRIICFAHNLEFDFTVLLNQDLWTEGNRQLLGQHCFWEYEGINIDFFNQKPYFGTIRYPDGKVIELKDTFSFFGPIKLDTLAKVLGIGAKIKIGKEDFKREGIHRDKKFREYAKEDSRLTALIGCKIMEFHAMDDLKPCVSGPQMAMMDFRKNFLRPYESMNPPEHDHLKYWELSYHGGANGCYVEAPKEYKNVYLYDINSAYPFAMTEIPSFLNCKYQVKEGNLKFEKGKVGIYRVSLVSDCDYNSTYDHDFTALKNLNDHWITSYELETLIEHGCIRKLKISAAMFVIPKSDRNPLGEYARHYYNLKQVTPKDSPLYYFYKVCKLNSLYGKFIERRIDEDNDFSIRGPNYNPAIASLVTGHARAYLHRLQHSGKALHCATDSVFTHKKMETGKGLGEISLEGFGDLWLLRTKFYLFWTDKKPKDKDIIKKGKLFLSKYATHGFHGKIQQVIELWKRRGIPRLGIVDGFKLEKGQYVYEKMPTAKEFFLHKKLKLKLFGMNKMKATVNIPWECIDE